MMCKIVKYAATKMAAHCILAENLLWYCATKNALWKCVLMKNENRLIWCQLVTLVGNILKCFVGSIIVLSDIISHYEI